MSGVRCDVLSTLWTLSRMWTLWIVWNGFVWNRFRSCESAYIRAGTTMTMSSMDSDTRKPPRERQTSENEEERLCPDVSTCSQCVAYEDCGWCDNGDGRKCVSGGEMAPTRSGLTCESGWRYSSCGLEEDSEDEVGFDGWIFRKRGNDGSEGGGLERRLKVYKEDAEFAKHNVDELNKFKDTLKQTISVLKGKLEGCRKTEEEKDAVAKIASKKYQEKKSDLDDAEREVEETSESIQQEQQNAADANSGSRKAAINALLNDLETRLERLKKDVLDLRKEILPLDQKKQIATMDRDEQTQVCDRHEISLKRAETQMEQVTVNQQWREEAAAARDHDAKTVQSLIDHNIASHAIDVMSQWKDPLPLGTAPNKPLQINTKDASPSESIPSVKSLSSVDDFMDKLLQGNRDPDRGKKAEAHSS